MLKNMRNSLAEGIYWKRIESKKPENLWEVQWTAEGIDLIKSNLNINKKEEIQPPANKTGKVVRKYVNPRVIGIVLDDDPNKEHNVLCRDSNKFIVNMPVEVRWDGLRWCIVKHPRFTGKY